MEIVEINISELIVGEVKFFELRQLSDGDFFEPVLHQGGSD